ncbi:MAG: hypothetical protein CL393_05775 [Acidiferrobacteraceae bacterium]|nr:hypothetical protein [Acidiferrobacteraceae bacterium]
MSFKFSFSRLTRFIVSLLLLTFVFYKTGLFSSAGRENLARMIMDLNWTILVISFFIAFIQNLVSAARWRIITKAKQLNGSFISLLKFIYIGRLFNLILPSSMGGDVMRILKLGKINSSSEIAAASVFVERFTGMFVLLLLSGISIISSLQFSGKLYVFSFFFTFAAMFMLGWLAIDSRSIMFFDKWSNKKHRIILERISSKLNSFQHSIKKIATNKLILTKIVASSIPFYVLAILNVWTSGLAFDSSIHLFDMIIAVPLIMLVMNLPVSIGGLGLMEASYTFSFDLLNYSAELGLTTALIMRAKTILDAVIGGIINLIDD